MAARQARRTKTAGAQTVSRARGASGSVGFVNLRRFGTMKEA